MAIERGRNVQAVAGSCPDCLGDLALQPVTGGWALICRACGIIVSGGPVRRAARESLTAG